MKPLVRRLLSVWRWLAVAGALAACGVAALILATSSAPGRSSGASWVTAWALPTNPGATTDFHQETIRLTLRSNFGGSRVRVHLENTNPYKPLTIADGRVGIVQRGALLWPKTNVALRFHDSARLTIPPGHTVLSDPVKLSVRPLQRIAVSLYVPRDSGLISGNHELLSRYWVARGDHAAELGAGGFAGPQRGGFLAMALDVYAPNDGLIVAFGDSITSGYDAEGRGWPVWLAQRLVDLAARGGPRLSIIDMGISGNRVLTDPASGELSAEQRLQRDVLRYSRVRAVLMMEGINDLGHSPDPPAVVPWLEAALARIVARVHAAGIPILLSPFTPAGDPIKPTNCTPGFSSPEGIRARHEVSGWIRHKSGVYLPGFDFEPVVADPIFSDELWAGYDSGDHLHPNANGQRAMSSSVDLAAIMRLVRGGLPYPSSGGAARPRPVIRNLRIAPAQLAYSGLALRAANRPPDTVNLARRRSAKQRRRVASPRALRALPVVRFSSSRSGVLAFTVLEQVKGAGGSQRCFALAPSCIAEPLSCERSKPLFTVRRRVLRGSDRLSLQRVLGHRRLGPGSYVLRVVPAPGFGSTPQTAAFRVLAS